MNVRFALLGAGRIGHVHARAVAGNDNATLATVYDPVSAAASSIADQYEADIRSVKEIAAADDSTRLFCVRRQTSMPSRLSCLRALARRCSAKSRSTLIPHAFATASRLLMKQAPPLWSGSTGGSTRISWA